MIGIYILSFAALVCAIIALVNKDSKPNAISITFGSVALIAAFAALAIAAPRDLEPDNLTVDYLGIIVAILGAFATLLLAMQLYNVFSVKEDAKKVAEAKDIIEKYAKQVSELEEKIKQQEEKSRVIDEEIKKRPIIETLTQQEYDHRNAEGKIDENTFYTIIDEKK